MRAILLASAAVIFSAASISSASAQNPPLNMDWSGIYVGGNIGGTWGRTNVQIPAYPANFNISSSSFSGGGQIGANWQTSDWLLLGVEGDISAMNLAGSHLSGGPPGERFTARYDLRYSARGRIGIVDDNTLFYVTGGWVGTDLARANFIPLAAGVRSDTLSGWTAGGGIEWAFDPNWIAGF